MLKQMIILPVLISGIFLRVAAQQYQPDIELTKKDTAARIFQAVKQQIIKPVPVRYDYYNSLGAACKAEFKLEKASGIPFRFRLGSLQQTDYMERKPNVQKPQ